MRKYTRDIGTHTILAIKHLYYLLDNEENLIKFKNFLLQFGTIDFSVDKIAYHHKPVDISKLDNNGFRLVCKYHIVYLLYYLSHYLRKIRKLIEKGTIDEKRLIEYRIKLYATIDELNKLGGLATEFLVRYVGYSFIGYNDDKIIVTSLFEPEIQFADYIKDGYTISRQTQLVYNNGYFIERQNIRNILEPLYGQDNNDDYDEYDKYYCLDTYYKESNMKRKIKIIN